MVARKGAAVVEPWVGLRGAGLRGELCGSREVKQTKSQMKTRTTDGMKEDTNEEDFSKGLLSLLTLRVFDCFCKPNDGNVGEVVGSSVESVIAAERS